MVHLAKSQLMQSSEGRASVEALQSFNVRHIEQLVSLLNTRSGRMALDELQLPLTADEIDTVVAEVRRGSVLASPNRFVQPGAFLQGRPPLASGLGYRTPVPQALPVFSQPLPPIERPEAKDPRLSGHFDATLLKYRSGPVGSPNHMIYAAGTLPEPKNQGGRGTCVAFAAASALQAYIEVHKKGFSRSRVFSEQYLYFEAKRQDRNRDEDGTRIECALQALVEHGVCADHYLPYRPYVDWSHSLLFEAAATDLMKIKKFAAGNKISNFVHLPDDYIVQNIKECLIRNLAVIVGVITFREAWGNEFASWRGEIELPIVKGDKAGRTNEELVFDTSDGGHAICIVGYEDDSDPATARPGGGAFVFKNSWGIDWAASNEHQRGYGFLPYAYVEKYWIEAAIIDGLATDTKGN